MSGTDPLSMTRIEMAAKLDELQAEIVALKSNAPPSPDQCPYPLHRKKFGSDHERYVASIGNLDVVLCEACGNVTLTEKVALAAAGDAE